MLIEEHTPLILDTATSILILNGPLWTESLNNFERKWFYGYARQLKTVLSKK